MSEIFVSGIRVTARVNLERPKQIRILYQLDFQFFDCLTDVSRMSIRQKVGSVLNRNPTSLEAEREQAIQNFFITLQKACYKNDEAPKEKHVRATICQTHEAHSSALFWKLAAKLPLAANAISCWKFCYIVHKLLRDGHHSMSKDSRAYIPKLEELGRYWGHIQGYGPLIDHYMKLLVTSVNFRVKYEFIPGTLKQDKIDLHRKIGNQVDTKFEFVLDVLDLLEQLLLFQKQIFRTFDRSGSSATNSGQNRLTPCVPVILDTQELYSMCVKFLSILHNELASEPLSGFRQRFMKQRVETYFFVR
jgi:huntingtin interacting protein 1